MATNYRRLRGNKSSAIPRRIIVLDTETVSSDDSAKGKMLMHRLRLGIADFFRIEGGKATSLKSAKFIRGDEFWQFVRDVSRMRETLWIFAHNTIYDFIQVGAQDRFTNGELVLDSPYADRKSDDSGPNDDMSDVFCCLESPPTIICCRDTVTNGRIMFVDTLNWFRESLRTIGGEIGFHKSEMPHPLDSDHKWWRYCRRDVDILRKLIVGLISFVSEHDLGMFRVTAASQSMAAYRHRFMDYPIYFHDDADAKALERDSYFGGRTACFSMGEVQGNLSMYDCNSLYPSIAVNRQFPTKLIEYVKHNEYYTPPTGIDYSSCIAECYIESTAAIYPKRMDGKVIYPVGKFYTTLAGPELNDAMILGRVKAIRSIAYYDCAPIFSSYVNYFWELRQQFQATENKLYEKLCKSFLNSLFGKFAQMSPTWINRNDKFPLSPWITWTEHNADKMESTVYRSVGWQVQESVERTELTNSLPAISSFVASYARLRMNDLRKIAGGDNVLYQGVDSLLVTELGTKNLKKRGELSNTELGKMKLKRHLSIATILAKNQYKLDDDMIFSGLRPNSVQIDEHTFASRSLTAKKDLFSGYESPGVSELSTIWRLGKSISDGTLGADGVVSPLVLSEPSPLG